MEDEEFKRAVGRMGKGSMKNLGARVDERRCRVAT